MASPRSNDTSTQGFDVLETTIADIHAAYQSGKLTSRQLVQSYLDRIDAYDQKGPAINSLISRNPRALEEADRLDAAFKASGLVGPLHGIPVIMKDQGDVKEMPTTLGSVLFKDYFFPFEVTSILLIVAAIAAMVLGQRRSRVVTQAEIDAHGAGASTDVEAGA